MILFKRTYTYVHITSCKLLLLQHQRKHHQLTMQWQKTTTQEILPSAHTQPLELLPVMAQIQAIIAERQALVTLIQQWTKHFFPLSRDIFTVVNKFIFPSLKVLTMSLIWRLTHILSTRNVITLRTGMRLTGARSNTRAQAEVACSVAGPGVTGINNSSGPRTSQWSTDTGNRQRRWVDSRR